MLTLNYVREYREKFEANENVYAVSQSPLLLLIFNMYWIKHDISNHLKQTFGLPNGFTDSSNGIFKIKTIHSQNHTCALI